MQAANQLVVEYVFIAIIIASGCVGVTGTLVPSRLREAGCLAGLCFAGNFARIVAAYSSVRSLSLPSKHLLTLLRFAASYPSNHLSLLYCDTRSTWTGHRALLQALQL
jgi:hypothetical protein